MVTLAVLSFMDLESQAASNLITLVLSGALLATAGALIFRGAIVRFHRSRFQTSVLSPKIFGRRGTKFPL
jgi:hypothetical protein